MYILTDDERNYLNKRIKAHYLYHDVDINTFFGTFSINLNEEFFGIITIKWTYKEVYEEAKVTSIEWTIAEASNTNLSTTLVKEIVKKINECKSEYDFISRDTKSFEWIDVKNESTGELVTQLIHIDRWMLIKCDKIIHSVIFQVGV